MPIKYAPDGSVELATEPKEVREFSTLGRAGDYVLEPSIVTDFALVRAAVGDRAGNLRFEESTRNFNPPVAMAGRITIAEVDRLVEVGELAPDDIHLPGIFVDRVIELTADQASELPIEKVTTR
jgi:acyl CoA:acetate/3-ketoacid CoA transferase alpha subunit